MEDTAIIHPAALEKSARKRKRPELLQTESSSRSSSIFQLDELNQDLLEQVLAWLPTSNFYRLTSVCKRWKSAASSATFKLTCSKIPAREPWFFMVDPQDPQLKNPLFVFDSAENSWKQISFFSSPYFQQLEKQSSGNFVPVAASGGLICFMSSQFEFIVCNPLTSSYKKLPPLRSSEQSINHLQAIAMISTPESYKIVLVHGEISQLSFRVYSSMKHQWEEEEKMHHRRSDSVDHSAHPCSETGSSAMEDDDDHAVYFLSKCGNVVSTDLQRSPCKQYSSVIIDRNAEKIMYFFSNSGRIVACNLTKKSYFEYPRILPLCYEYSIDLVESNGEVYVVLLMEFLESASLRVWKFDELAQSWDQIAAMPPSMSHEFYGKKVDINCSGGGNEKQVLVCLNSAEVCSYFLCNLVENQWEEVPKCSVGGEVKDFSCAFTFEPRIEASV
ncbi:OLC1v1030309C1 [Oldenlandia corymbosa var. corymbosa]|uniref:OLC1v1030309C1 n=1 Tax=Oldenlandia corymbosa var. corymbosa TaxID=529605 RepID=A0AAV1CFQ7_OLDCO|nr:OLC1v1030309C1 [Oldenlandia corymbosa var. corymbosa]